ncbi:MAG: hypothetical protein KIT84_15755 [Labilithrix sp.]|nr:hypothetical protein [Labilithrix sp.]MCW5812482.1 hypothetical protein [Labilithrix sp.]
MRTSFVIVIVPGSQSSCLPRARPLDYRRDMGGADGEKRTWKWEAKADFYPHYDVTASAGGLDYGCEIKGPFCGWDPCLWQSWDAFLTAGAPAYMQMPASIAEEIRTYAVARELIAPGGE